MTTLRRLFVSDSDATTVYKILTAPIEVPSRIVPSAGVFDDVIMLGLERDLTKRFGSAREMASALERAVRPASAAEVNAWVESMALPTLATRAQLIAEIETASTKSPLSSSTKTRSEQEQLPVFLAEVETATDFEHQSSAPKELHAPAPHRFRRVALVVGLLSIIVAAVLIAFAIKTGVQGAQSATPASSSTVSESPVAPVLSASVAVVAPAVSASASTSGPSSVAPAPNPTPTQTPKRPVSRPPNTAQCNPPYRLLPNGIKKWKPECVGK